MNEDSHRRLGQQEAEYDRFMLRRGKLETPPVLGRSPDELGLAGENVRSVSLLSRQAVPPTSEHWAELSEASPPGSTPINVENAEQCLGLCSALPKRKKIKPSRGSSSSLEPSVTLGA